MSIEVWQFPEKATDSELIELLIEIGYEDGENLFWHGPEGTKHYFWANATDFKSTSGVDASVFPIDDEGKKALNVKSCEWVLRTRTSIWASSFDKDFQNHPGGRSCRTCTTFISFPIPRYVGESHFFIPAIK